MTLNFFARNLLNVNKEDSYKLSLWSKYRHRINLRRIPDKGGSQAHFLEVQQMQTMGYGLKPMSDSWIRKDKDGY